jgi:TRAP-type transport system small permease protein
MVAQSIANLEGFLIFEVFPSEALDELDFIGNDSATNLNFCRLTKSATHRKSLNMLTQSKSKISPLKRCAEWFLVATLSGMVVAVFSNVVLRYGFGTSIVFYEELSRLLFVWLVCVGAVLASADRQHLSFDMLTTKLNGRSAFIATLLARLAIAACLILVLHGSWVQVKAGLASFSTVMGFPLALVAASTLLMSAVMLVFLGLEVKTDPFGLKAHQAALDQQEARRIE